ncbi:hypothetical protein Pcinc_030717 [Petrolisthes cinctipes]|uniref:Uncharacterized protein n=1 Tax=Petrolisthes cinctipes TaxID=88211 RepID=A0AAE1K264_PETCI|nr:hypothetical protein Pcinc_030717 [Petrolisthes cinctipes]
MERARGLDKKKDGMSQYQDERKDGMSQYPDERKDGMNRYQDERKDKMSRLGGRWNEMVEQKWGKVERISGTEVVEDGTSKWSKGGEVRKDDITDGRKENRK